MNVAAVVYKHITPSAAQHLHRVNIRLVRVYHAAEIFAHTVITVKASV